MRGENENDEGCELLVWGKWAIYCIIGIELTVESPIFIMFSR